MTVAKNKLLNKMLRNKLIKRYNEVLLNEKNFYKIMSLCLKMNIHV